MLSVKCITYEGNFPFGLGGITPCSTSDGEAAICGALQGMQKAQQTKTAKVLRILPKAAIGAFILGSALKQPGKLSNKLNRALLTTGEFAVLGAGLKVFDKVTDKCVDESHSAKEFEKEHPALSAVLGFGGAIIAMGLALLGAKKLVHFAAKKCPQIAQNITKEFKKAADFIDKKPVAKSVEDFKIKYQNFSKKRGQAYKFAVENALPIGLLAYIAAGIGLGGKYAKEKDELIKQNIIEARQKRNLMNLVMMGM